MNERVWELINYYISLVQWEILGLSMRSYPHFGPSWKSSYNLKEDNIWNEILSFYNVGTFLLNLIMLGFITR